MSILRLNKQWAGNVCLIVFAALLFSMVFSTVGVDAAHAGLKDSNGKVTISDEGNPSKGSQNTENPTQESLATIYQSDSQGKEYKVKIKLQPVTPTEFENMWMQLKVGSFVYQTVYLEDVSGATYTGYAVYELVYTFVCDGQVFPPGVYELAFYDDSGNLKSVYLEFKGKPPEGGGGGGIAAPPAVTPGQPIETKPVVSGNTATATVDAESVTKQLKQDSQATAIAIKVPETAGVSEVKTQIPAQAVTAVANAQKAIRVETQVGTFLLPPALLAAPEVKNLLVTGAKLELAAKVVEDTQAAPLLETKAPEAVPAGKVLEFNLNVVSATGTSTRISSFTQRVWVTLPVDKGKLGDVPAWKLGVYRYNETTGTWDYVGGKVNADGTVSVGLSSFSKYTVMAYDKTFADIKGHWGWKDIEIMAARHVAQGVDSTRFEPDREITRAEFAALLLRSLGYKAEKSAKATFADISADKWYFGEVETARRVGLVVGYEDNTFRPDQKITRQEMAAMVTRALEVAGKPVALTGAEVEQALAGYADASGIKAWARIAVAVAVNTGIAKGRTATTLAPLVNATRAESVVMIKRMLAQVGEI
ncbi:hypothetical protein SY88_11655 [Clostridiales bacterium PH28_bin88]|nr:hypothetical protein SY88_11655 [Clostridiales bacterium PH28_bin88]